MASNKSVIHVQRPPRHKTEARSAGILVEVVRTLTTSPSQAQKELQKDKLEKDFAATGQNIDRLLANHQIDLTSSLQTFRKVSSKLTSSRERVKSLKTNLSSCKTLLQCKRDELKQLWFEAAEQSRVVNLLKIIETVRVVPYEVDEAISKKCFLHAAQLLMTSVSHFQKSLTNIEGLLVIRESVERRIQETREKIFSELDVQIYLRPLEEIAGELRRIGSMRRASAGALNVSYNDSNLGNVPFSQLTLSSENVDRLSLPASLKSLQNAYIKRIQEEEPMLMDDGFAYEDPNGFESDRNHVQYLSVLVEALGVFNCLPEAVDQLKRVMPRGLSKILQYTSFLVYEYFANSNQVLGDSRLLAELLQLTFRQFSCVSVLLQFVAEQSQRASRNQQQRTGSMPNFYSSSLSENSSPSLNSNSIIEQFWYEAQACLKRTLDEYLDAKRPFEDGVPTIDYDVLNVGYITGRNFSQFFGRKRMPQRRLDQAALFRFDRTLHHSTSSTVKFLEDQQSSILRFSSDEMAFGADELKTVCSPNIDNVTVVFKPLMQFIGDIELTMGTPCSLRLYLDGFTRDIYLPKIKMDTDRQLELDLKNPDSWTSLASNDELASWIQELPEGHSRTPILASTVKIAKMCQRFEMLMHSAPASFLENFAHLWLRILSEYLKSVKNVYESSSKAWTNNLSFSTENRIASEKGRVSTCWAMDEDISRLLKSLPNWLTLYGPSDCPFNKSLLNHSRTSSSPTHNYNFCNGSTATPGSISTPSCDSVDSARDIRLRNQRESEILISNLGTQKCIDESEILLDDFNQLRCFCNVHESIEWLSWQMSRSLEQFSPSVRAKLEKIPTENFNGLDCHPKDAVSTINLYEAFQKMVENLWDGATTCLLILHLEVRVLCFYYLLNLLTSRFTQIPSSVQEIDDAVLKLNKGLSMFHSTCRSNLQAKKLKYIFEGLGHLIASIYVNACPNLPRLNDLAKNRLCRGILALQQNLSSLTGYRESDLDSARLFFELLYKSSPDEIFNSILHHNLSAVQEVAKEADFQHLIALYVKSHPIYGNEPGVLEKLTIRLKEMWREKSKE